jgi:purine-nucleoside/S-methyl-5'-thioadenosine phosphorylase / adenosine deaminase
MTIKTTFNRIEFNGYYAHVYETPRLVMGFTENDFPLNELARLFNVDVARVKELKQIHSNKIFFSSAISAREEQKGDGILLDERERLAVIKTADCTPLFLWDHRSNIGGVLHIGWQGLEQGIEIAALKLLANLPEPVDPEQLSIYLGPAIEPSCYEVGQDLFDRFAAKGYGKDIFVPNNNKGKFLMDIKKGIGLSLQKMGVADDQIEDCGYCTYCRHEMFPSYRREPEIDGRIYNFMYLKGE